MRKNRVKARIHVGESVFGIWFEFPVLQAVEIAGALGFDYIFIDGEHGTFNLTDIEQMCIVANAMGLTVNARVPNIHPSTILQFLDRGVQGITGPHIRTKNDAETLVKACRFAPQGVRGFFWSRPAGYSLPQDVPAYMAAENEEVWVAAGIEEEEGLRNLQEILSVEGLDSVGIGQFDLSQDMGYPGNPEHPRVKEAIDKAMEQIRAAGKALRPGGSGPSWISLSTLIKTGAGDFLIHAKGG